MTPNISDRHAARWTIHITRILFSFCVALFVVLFLPFRVADCGPADPHLMRFLGAPFLHQTGIGIGSSLEARIWAGPTLANITFWLCVIWIAVTGLARAIPRRPSRAGSMINLALCAGLIATTSVLVMFMIDANTFIITRAGPTLDAQNCDFHFELFPDNTGWQPEQDQTL